MNTQDLIKSQHTVRKAMIYIRQSSPNQILTNQESLKLQYSLKKKAVELGWPEQNIEVIDSDLGISGSSTEGRQGFKDLVTHVTLGHVGIILSYDVTRLSRNCSDWYQLLDICGVRDCLIADRDGVYNPAIANGRLLLGLKGQISELELHTLKSRLTAGLINKAQRGDLALQLPCGFIRDKFGIVSKSPNIEVQQRIQLIFDIFLRVKSASKTFKYFKQQNLTIPRKDNIEDIKWKKPTLAIILSILKNPAYAGMFVYGRSRSVSKGQSLKKNSKKKLPIEEWKIKVEDKYPAYISKETYDNIQTVLKDNRAEYDVNQSRGIPRTGKALLHGISYCGECGHKMVVKYKGGVTYICNFLKRHYQTKICQYILCNPIDVHVEHCFFEALSPIELDMYEKAIAAKSQQDDKATKAKLQQVERLRYQARLAERQYNQVDPDNRLVASELERRWEAALIEAKHAELELEKEQKMQSVPMIITQKMKIAFENIGKKLPDIWHQNLLSQPQRKALLRCLIDKVVMHRIQQNTIEIRIVWKGGETSTAQIQVPVNSFKKLSNSSELEKMIVKMAMSGVKDSQIAEILTKQGFRSPKNEILLRNTVQTIRLKNDIMINRKYSFPRRIEGYLTVAQLAKLIGVSTYWFHYRIATGKIHIQKDKKTGLFLFPDVPSTQMQLKAMKDGHLQSLRY